MHTVCDSSQCTACSACADICPKGAIQLVDNIKNFSAVIDERKCIHCGLCEEVCQIHNPVQKEEPVRFFQGWSKNPETRRKASSGGAATELIGSFIQNGGIAYSCMLTDGVYKYVRVDNTEIINRLRGSKYVKSNPAGIYCRVKDDLREGRKVLFVGLPCHVGALKRFIDRNLQSNLYTIDLICHGTPSPQILLRFLSEHSIQLNKVSDMLFRVKGDFHYYKQAYIPIQEFGVYDAYSFGFLEGVSLTENCFQCNYASYKRVGDISLGDARGSKLAETESIHGLSLVFCNSAKGDRLLKNSNLHLEKIDRDIAISGNAQLKAPAHKPIAWELFYGYLKKGVSIDKTIRRLLPKLYYKEKIKCLFVKLGLIKSGTVYGIAVKKNSI